MGRGMQQDELMQRFERWVRAFQPVVYRAAYLILRDRSGAEDVAQDTFIRAYRALERSDPGDAVRSWLYRIAVNTALNELRRRKRETAAYARVDTPDVALAPDVETRSVVADAIDKLPDHLRIPVICKYFLDLSEQEMAEVLRIRPGTVKSRLHLARKALEKDETLAVTA
jgi:RNA polymerase sigma-70 factor, ECF subfamily